MDHGQIGWPVGRFLCGVRKALGRKCPYTFASRDFERPLGALPQFQPTPVGQVSIKPETNFPPAHNLRNNSAQTANSYYVLMRQRRVEIEQWPYWKRSKDWLTP